MKIATVTLNPAIDQTVKVDNFRPNTVNRALAISFDASGKGINVVSFLADYGHDTAVTCYRRTFLATLMNLLFRDEERTKVSWDS